jgi:tetratricopeptide (TPR) repeat protein
LPQSPVPAGFYVTGMGGTVYPSLGTVHDFTVGSTTIHHLEFLVGGSEVGSAGVIGQNILHFRDVEYDLAGGMIRLMDSHDCGHANLAYWAKPEQVSIVPLMSETVMGRPTQHTIGTVSVNGVKMRALFDTGASASSLTLAAAERAGVHVGDSGVIPSPSGRGIGRKLVRSWLGTFQSVDIGGEQIRNTRLRISDVSDTDFDMLVGADFFLSHHVYVANGLHRLYLTYNGGQVFRLRERGDDEPATPTAANLSAAQLAGATLMATVPGAAEPTDAEGFARRGAARLARRDPGAALKDYDEAVRRAPDRADILLQRARVHLVLRQPLLANADLDAALKLTPDDAEAHLIRAELRLRTNDRDGAREDADAVARLAAKPANLRLGLGALYQNLDLFEQAVGQYDLWIAAHPDDSRRAAALNGRCWARALANRELPQALSDCDAAVRREAGNPDYLDSRGLVHLRMGAYDKAIADYDKALAINPHLAFSLYGRGLAEIAKGDAAGGKADIAAATAAEPNMGRRAHHYGLAQPG